MQGVSSDSSHFNFAGRRTYIQTAIKNPVGNVDDYETSPNSRNNSRPFKHY